MAVVWVQAAEKAMSRSNVMAQGFQCYHTHSTAVSYSELDRTSAILSAIPPPLIFVLVDCCFDLEKCGGQRGKQRGKYKPRRIVRIVED